MTQLPIPVHVGSEPPAHWDDVEARQREYGEEATPWLQKQRRPATAKADLDWAQLSFEPRWVGSDTADCVVALHPSIYSGHGADEFTRFRQGAASREEVALVVSPIGDLDEEPNNVRNVFGPPVASVSIGHTYTSVYGRLLGKGTSVRLARDLGVADGDLGRRLLNYRPSFRWRSLSLSGAMLESAYGREQRPAEGTLLPILETELGEPVAAIWVAPDGGERRYVVPVETPWILVLDWLREQAVPEFVPGAMRRARRQLGSDVFLMTRSERAARTALADFEAGYLARKVELEQQVEEAEAAASSIREGLLYGTGQELVRAVHSVLASAGVEVVDLDEKLAGTKNADLLCTYGRHARLVEVKSASGRAPERAYQDLVRHLREWPVLPGSVPVDGGVLVINHEHRKVPQDRGAHPFERPEFLAAQVEPVVPTLALFDAWRGEDYREIRRLLFGPAAEPEENARSSAGPPRQSAEPPAPEARGRRWFGRR